MQLAWTQSYQKIKSKKPKMSTRVNKYSSHCDVAGCDSHILIVFHIQICFRYTTPCTWNTSRREHILYIRWRSMPPWLLLWIITTMWTGNRCVNCYQVSLASTMWHWILNIKLLLTPCIYFPYFCFWTGSFSRWGECWWTQVQNLME